VSASSNVGRVFVGEDHEIEVDCFVRCAIGFSEEIIGFQHARAARLTGFHTQAESYPGWAGDESNPLAQTMSGIYKRLAGQSMEITAVHVGLEPSVLGAKQPDMVMVSTGPDILNPHSTDEHAPVKGLATYVRLLAGTLDELSKR
jgi:dipeptidase D